MVRNRAMAEANSLTLAAVGDIMSGCSYDWRYLTEPDSHYACDRLRNGLEIIGPQARSVLQEADLTF